MRADRDRVRRAGTVEDQQLLSIGRRVVGRDVGGPGRRHEAGRQAGVGEHRVAVRLHDVDGPWVRVGAGRARDPAQDVDHLRGVVVDDPAGRGGERMLALVDRPLLGRVATDREDLVARAVGLPRGRVQPGVVEARDHCQAVGTAIERHRRDQRHAGGIDERDAAAGGDRDARHLLDADPGQASVGDGLVQGGPDVARPGTAQDDRRARRRLRELGLVVGSSAAEDLGQGRRRRRWIRDVGHGRDQRRARAAVRQVRDARQVEGPKDAARQQVDHGEGVARCGDHGGPIRGHQQVLDRVVDGDQRLRGRAEVDRDVAERRGVERGDPPVVVAEDQLAPDRVEGQRACARGGHHRDQPPVGQVVRPDLAAGGHVEPVAGLPAGGLWILPSRLDDRGPDRDAERAGGVDVVLAPQDQTGGHGVLGQVRVRPFVDVVGQPVAPVLQELRRGPSVVDLVEVHLVRLGQPERSEQEAADHQHDQQPQVQPVEAAAALAGKQRAPVGADGTVAKPRPEPADDPELGEAGPGGPGRQPDAAEERWGRFKGRRVGREWRRIVFGARRGAGRWPGGGWRLGPRRHEPRCRGGRRAGRRRAAGQLGHDRGGVDPVDLAVRFIRHLELILQRAVAVAPELQERPGEGSGVGDRDGGHAGLGPDRATDTEPVRHRRIVGIEGRQNDVHVGEGRRGQGDVDPSPAPRHRREDDADREERVAVALVDTRRDGEEGQRQDGDADQHGQAIRPPRHDPQDEHDRREQQHGADQDGWDARDRCAAGATLVGAADEVADPRTRVGQAVPQVAGDDRPQVVGVHGQVRVAAGGLGDLFEQAGSQERRLAAEPDDREPERQAEDHGGQVARQRRREDPDRAPRPLRIARPAGRPQRATDGDDRDERNEDPQLGLDDRRDHREDRRPLRPIPP